MDCFLKATGSVMTCTDLDGASASFISVLQPHTRTSSLRHLGDDCFKYVLYHSITSFLLMFFSSSASFFDMSKMYLKIYNTLSSNHHFMNKANKYQALPSRPLSSNKCLSYTHLRITYISIIKDEKTKKWLFSYKLLSQIIIGTYIEISG